MFKNKKILITGGTGSFGMTFLKELLSKHDCKEIIVFSRDEKKQNDLRITLNSPKVKFHIGDVRDYSSIEAAVDGVNYIFHAAALKQVPSCEFFPIEAVKTNILGTENVLSAADKSDVKKVVVLSTDKAVYPINVMGLTKSLMEKVMISKSMNQENVDKIYCGTRYGNVMGSRGSVIPLFIKQIKMGEPLTITNPNMSRFMMNLDEAVDLVLFAFKHGNSGDIYVQKSPSTTIITVAKALLEIYKSKNQIKVIGTRHGEKKYETLVSKEEMNVCEEMENYYRIPADNRDLNYDQFISKGKTDFKSIEYNSDNANILNLDQTIKLLKNLPFINNDLKDL